MALRLYNTRTRRIEPFAPLDPPRVRIYVCGLTPSAQAHLGHARSFLFFDLLRRYLTHCGYEVTYVQNVTDIDDRSIKQAIETGRPWNEIVAGFYGSFKTSLHDRLGVLPFDSEPYATAYIPQIVAMIAQLIERGYAYRAKDGVYYRVAAFARYGALSNRNTQELESGARIEVDESKEDPLDFALWKFAKPGEPTWPSPWGEGRPGWHIECSAMSRALLDPGGNGFDIHGGGADLIFPHHENEIAQSEPLMDHPPMASFWVHGGLLLFDNQKMSKSLGNFEPLSDLLERHDPQALRLLFLQTCYRKVMNFTEESVAAASSALERLKKTYRALRATADGANDGFRQPAPLFDSASFGRSAQGDTAGLIARIEAALDDDMNTAAALAQLFSHSFDGVDAREALREFTYALNLLGLTPDAEWERESVVQLPADFLERLRASGFETLEAALALRSQARANKDWAESDRLRDLLLQCGVALKDSKDGTTWSIVQ